MNTFSNDELEYIYASVTDSSQDIYRSSASEITAKLPNGKYCLAIRNMKDRQTIRDNLMIFYNIPTVTDMQSIYFTVKNNEQLKLNFVYEHSQNIILSLRQQAVLNHRLEKGLIAKDIVQHLIINKSSTNLGKKYNRDSFYSTIQECLDEDIIIWLDDSKSLDDEDVRYLRKMKLLQNKKLLTRQKQILDAKLANLQRLEEEISKY